MDKRISTERVGHVLAIGLDRVEKRNAFDPAMFNALADAYGMLERDDELRCGVLFAHGDHFTGGLDLVAMTPVLGTGRFTTPSQDGGAVDPLDLFAKKRTKPIVCGVQGICFTIGIELMLACDVRVAASNTRFGQIEVKRGIYPIGGATIRFIREVGWGNTMRWLLTGDELSAEEAHRIGLVQELVPAADVRARAMEIATIISAQAPLGVRATLASSRLSVTEGEAAAAARLFPDLVPILGSDDAREGVQSFVERRAAKFTGK